MPSMKHILKSLSILLIGFLGGLIAIITFNNLYPHSPSKINSGKATTSNMVLTTQPILLKLSKLFKMQLYQLLIIKITLLHPFLTLIQNSLEKGVQKRIRMLNYLFLVKDLGSFIEKMATPLTLLLITMLSTELNGLKFLWQTDLKLLVN